MIERIAVRLRDGIAIAITILSVVGSIARRPSLAIERAVQTLRNRTLAQTVGVEECTSLEAAIRIGMLAVVL